MLKNEYEKPFLKGDKMKNLQILRFIHKFSNLQPFYTPTHELVLCKQALNNNLILSK